MNISTDLMASLGLAALTANAETELTVPPLLLLQVEPRQPAQNLNGTIGATITQTTINFTVVDQTNVAASSRVLYRIKKGLWRITLSAMKEKNFAGTVFSSDFRVTMGYDAALADAQDIYRDPSAGALQNISWYNFRDHYHLVGNQDLIIGEFEETTVGVGNRARWSVFAYLQKIL